MTGRTGARMAIVVAFAAIVALGTPSAAPGGKTAPSGLALRHIAGFESPVYVAQAPGQPHTLYVVEQPGRVMAVRKGRKSKRPFLKITDRVRYGAGEATSREAGLLSIAFDPNYPRTGRVYAFYTGPGGHNYVDVFRRQGKRGSLRAARRSRRSVLKISHPYADSHNGGQLQFGPDGNLWISTGDGGCCDDPNDQARSLGTLLGKLLRIDPRANRSGYRIPRSNPLRTAPGRNEIYAWGFRNPWRFSFDLATGQLSIADVGDEGRAQEEVSILSPAAAAGMNFGWPEYEGLRRAHPARPGTGPKMFPVFAYGHETRECAITGGYVVRDPKLPQLYGRYVFADFCLGRLKSFVPPAIPAGGAPLSPATDVRDEGLYARFVSSFGQGLGGQIYVVSNGGGVYRLEQKR